jgi:hypothetical protein
METRGTETKDKIWAIFNAVFHMATSLGVKIQIWRQHFQNTPHNKNTFTQYSEYNIFRNMNHNFIKPGDYSDISISKGLHFAQSIGLLNACSKGCTKDWKWLRCNGQCGDCSTVLFSTLQKTMYEACLESNDTKVLTMYNFFNLQKWHCEWIAFT